MPASKEFQLRTFEEFFEVYSVGAECHSKRVNAHRMQRIQLELAFTELHQSSSTETLLLARLVVAAGIDPL